MATSDIFTQCSPSIRTNIQQCGSVSLCTDTKIETASDLDTIYKEDGDFRVLGAMLANAFELKACGMVQNSWQDFFMANLKPMKKNIELDKFTETVRKIKPFITANQKHPINNNYWRASGGTSSGENWRLDIESKSGIPADVRSFPVGMRIYVQSKKESGAMNIWRGVVVSSVIAGDAVRVVLTPQNDGTAFDDVENPTTGVVRRGSANVGATEAYCDDQPGYITDTAKEFWYERTQTTLCWSERYNDWLMAVKENNPLYAKYFHLEEADLNKQKLQQFNAEIFENVMFSGPISEKQNKNDYRELPEITNAVSNIEGMGVAPGACDGYKANVIGWLEQLRQCNRIYDALGDNLDLWSLMDAIYILSRVRQGVGSAGAVQFDIFTDSTMADLIELAFIQLFKARSADTLQMNFTIESGTNKTFGFYYRRFKLVGKAGGIILNIITATALDDYLAEWVDYSAELADNTVATGGHALWLLDAGGLYIGVIESDRDMRESGNIKDLVKVDPSWLCVKTAPIKRVTIVDSVYTAVVECPAANLLIWNVGGGTPVYVQSADRPDYLQSTIPIYNVY